MKNARSTIHNLTSSFSGTVAVDCLFTGCFLASINVSNHSESHVVYVYVTGLTQCVCEQSVREHFRLR